MNNEEKLFSFYMHEAAAHPQDFLNTVRGKAKPEYWENFWAYYAALRVDDTEYTDEFYEENIYAEDYDYEILLAYEFYIGAIQSPENAAEYLTDARDHLENAEGKYSPLLQEACKAMRSLIPVEREALPVESNFYTQQLFVPVKSLSVEYVREGLHQTKTKEEWLREINFLADRLEWHCVDCMLHIPEGWEGMTRLDLDPLELPEHPRALTCYGLWKEGKENYSPCLDEKEEAPKTMHLQSLKNMASFQTLAQQLLQRIDEAKEGPIGWS